MLYAVHFTDARERKHVVALSARTPEEALNAVIEWQNENGPGAAWQNGFYFDPSLDNVVEIEHREGVQVLWHNDYD